MIIYCRNINQNCEPQFNSTSLKIQNAHASHFKHKTLISGQRIEIRSPISGKM